VQTLISVLRGDGRESHDFPLFNKRSKTSFFVTYRYPVNISYLDPYACADFSLARPDI
jgi:hypothetical protein